MLGWKQERVAMGKEPRRPSDSTAVLELGARARATERAAVEALVEADASLVPHAPSALLVEPAVLEPAEVAALLADLENSLDRAAGAGTSTMVSPAATGALQAS